MVSGSEGERGRGGKERGRAGSIFEIGMMPDQNELGSDRGDSA